MKRIYWVLLFFPLCLFSQEHFYYYKGEKQYLELDTSYVFVSTTNKTSLENSNGVMENTLNFHKEQTSAVLKQKQNIALEFYWAEISLSQKTTKESYTQFVNRIKQIDGIQTVSPYFIGKVGDKIGLSNFFYVKLKSNSDIALLNDYSIKNKVIVVSQDKFMPLWFVLSVTNRTEGNAIEMANLFYESGLFEYAEPDLIVGDLVHSPPNDTYFSNQWGLHNTGQYGGTTGIDIKALDAWNISTGTGVTVAVLDQGIELDHPDMQANIHHLSYDTETGTSPSIVRGNHGVACAGIIGAVRNNSTGIAGIAPNVKLLSISNGLTINTNVKQNLASGINWAVQNGADIINNSWGHNDLVSSLIDDAITNAITIGRNGKGVIVIFSTGNDNSTINYPANSNPDILTVGAMSPCGQRKSPSSCDGEHEWGSNYGSQLDVVAPGVLIATTDRQGNNGYNPNSPIHIISGGNKIYSDYADENYTVWFNGTSAATPYVSGVAALILSVNPNLTGQQVRNIIEQTSQKVGGYSYANTSGRSNGTWHNEMGYGLVDAYAAVNAGVSSQLTLSGPSTLCMPSIYTVDDLPSGATVTWQVGNGLSLTTSQNMATVSGTGTGFSSWIKAEVNTGSTTVTLPQKEIWIGSSISSITGPQHIPLGGNADYYAITLGDLNNVSYQWSITPSLPFMVSGSSMSVNFPYINADYAIKLTTTNSCGSTVKYHYLATGAYEPDRVYPNPSSDMVHINLQETNDKAFAIQNKKENQILGTLFDYAGNKVIQVDIVNGKGSFSVKHLSKGVYVLKMNVNGRNESHRIIVK